MCLYVYVFVSVRACVFVCARGCVYLYVCVYLYMCALCIDYKIKLSIQRVRSIRVSVVPNLW